MKSLSVVGLLALLGTGCYREYGPGAVQPMGNIQPDPVAVSGPPGGAVDPGYAYDQPNVQDPALPGYPAGYPEGYPAGTEFGQPADPYAPQPSGAPGNEMGTVTDAQIDSTLAPYGEWVESEEYGQVWRPHATVVGAGFTPYETCGSWVWTDYGWTYNCDWDWGWLPFHYGNWDWFDGGWAWIPDYTWGPGWVDWRYGSGYVGWRPTPPRGDIVRDHRRPYRPTASGAAKMYIPKSSRDSHWRFVAESSLGRGHVRGNLVSPAHGLAVTGTVSRPPFRGRTTVSAAQLMSRGRGTAGYRTPAYQPARPAYRGQDAYRPAYRGQDVRGGYAPRYDQRQPTRVEPSRGYNPYPSRGTYNPAPSRTYNPAPSRTYNPAPSRTYNPAPSRPSSSSSSYRPSSSSSSSRASSPSSSSSSRSSGSSSSSRGSSSSSSSSSGGRGRR